MLQKKLWHQLLKYETCSSSEIKVQPQDFSSHPNSFFQKDFINHYITIIITAVSIFYAADHLNYTVDYHKFEKDKHEYETERD